MMKIVRWAMAKTQANAKSTPVVSSAFTTFLLLALCATSANAAELEKLMRDVQVRRLAMGLAPASYPAKNGWSPTYPPDGFYDLNNATERAAAVNIVSNAFWDGTSTTALYRWYYNNEDLTGTITDLADRFVLSDFASPKAAAANSGTSLAIIQQIIDDLQVNVDRLTFEYNQAPSNPVSSLHPWLRVRTVSTEGDACGPALGEDIPGICYSGECDDYETCKQYQSAYAQMALAAAETTVTDGMSFISGTLLCSYSFTSSRGRVGFSNQWAGCVSEGSSPGCKYSGHYEKHGSTLWIDLTGYPGNVCILAEVEGDQGNAPIPADGNYHILTDLAGGRMHSITCGEYFFGLEQGSLVIRGAYYKSNYRLTQNGLNNVPVVAIDQAQGVIEGELGEGNLVDSDCGGRAGSNPRSSAPVSLASGTKQESVTDLVVQVTGEDFTFTREYTSDPDVLAAGAGNLIGTGWSSDCFRYITEDFSGTYPVIRLGGPPLDNYLEFQAVEFDSGTPIVWSAGGPATQRLVKDVVTIEGVEWPVWRLEEPGLWSKEFVRTPDSGEPSVDSALVGLLLRELDPYENSRYYTYHTQNVSNPRLYAIYINGYPSEAYTEAEIVFDWILDGPSSVNGKLRSIEVRRPQVFSLDILASTGYVVTQRVEYFYGATPPIDPSTELPVSVSADVGDDDDLIQVVRHTFVDGDNSSSEPMYATVSQYRYHTSETAPTADDDRLQVRGLDHQLKWAIMPEQLEYYAELTASGTAGPDSMLNAAQAFLALDDDDSFTAGSDTYYAADFPAKILSYDTSNYGTTGESRVEAQYLQSGCGCGGSPSQGLKLSYEYLTYTGGQTTVITENTFSGSQTSSDDYTTLFRTTYHDLAPLTSGGPPYLINKAVQEPGMGGRTWVWHNEYDATVHTLARALTPAACSSYTPASGSTPPSYTASASAGLVSGYKYDANNRLTETRVAEGDVSGGVDNFTLMTRTTYGSLSEVDERPWLPEKVERFNVEKTGATPTYSADEVETVEFDYAFYKSNGTSQFTDGLVWVRSIEEAETVAENGPSAATTYSTITLMDPRGRPTWVRAADGTLTYTSYDSMTGLPTLVVANADPESSSHSFNPVNYLDADQFDSTGDYDDMLAELDAAGKDGNGDPLPGGELATTIERDALGRVTMTTTPGGVSSYVRRELRPIESRPNVYYFTEVVLPHQLGGSGDNFNGPVSITWMNAGGKVIGSSSYSIDGSQPYEPEMGDYTFDSTAVGQGEIGRSRMTHSLSGLVKSTKVWNSVYGDESYETSFEYDAMGRVSKTIDAEGTVSENAEYDIFNHVLETKIGTVSTSTETVAKYFYDSATMAQGVGNGNLTFTRLYTGENGGFVTTYRDTQHVYDGRDRLRKTIPPLNAGVQQAPYVVLAYDNLDRVIQRGLFTGSPTATGNDYGIGDTSKRAFYVEMHYGQRGMLARKRVATDPAQSSPNWLATDTWYDSVGRAVSQSFPSSPRIKRVFDAHGRSIEEYLTDARNDVAPGASGSYEDAVDVDDDVVLEQTVREYNDDDLLVSEHMYSLVHDEQGETTFGSLVDAASSKRIVTTTGYVYDDADRVAATIDYGTNDADDKFITGTALPTVPTTVAGLSSLPAWAIVTQVGYEPNRGVVNKAIDPLGRVTTTVYDDLLRTIATIENYDDTNPVTLAWDGTHGRWSVTAGLNISEPDVNRVTSFVYDGLDHVTRRVAHIPGTSGEKVQVTAYEYGVVSNSPNYAHNSLVNSNNLLFKIRYPDDTTGEASTSSDHAAWFSYDRLGEMRFAADQNGGGHAYHRDTAGRVTRDWAITVSSLTGVMAIDSTVSSIYTSYDKMGRMTSVKSRDASGGIINSVRFEYTPLWQIDKVYQDADGTTADSGGPLPEVVVDYDYQTLTGGGAYGNASRLTQMAYPSGSALEYLYDDNVSSRISRVTNLELDGTNIVQYSYLGASTPVVTDYTSADVQLDYTLDADGKRRATGYTETAQGYYPGLDRFGRVKRHTWADGGLHYDGTSGPTMAPHISRLYSYDVNANVLTDYDDGTGSARTDDDFAYQYDELDRLIESRRGAWDGSAFTESSVSGDKRSESWQLDMLGNWLEYRRNLDGMVDSGTQLPEYNNDGSSPLETQSRTFNAFNEITALDPDAAGAASSLTSFTYDHNGTLREMPPISTGPTESEGGPAKRFFYDCWNRLVRVEEKVDGTNFTPIAEYEYNGLNWRTKKTCRTDQSSTTMPQTRVMYYDASWRLLEEHIDEPSTGGVECEEQHRVAQQVWGLRGLDDAILRRLQQSVCVDVDLDPEDEVHDWQLSFNIPSTYAGWDATYYYLTDATFSPRGITLADGTLYSRLDYDAYGRGRRWMETNSAADFNGVGGVTVQDIFDFLTAWLAGCPNTPPDPCPADFNGVNGVTVQDIFDFLTAWLAGGGPEVVDGLISQTGDVPSQSMGVNMPAPDNPIGYRGYVFNPEVSGGGLYTVRHRTYLPLLGRWNERDPAGFVDGGNLYEYVMSGPITGSDPMGLDAQDLAIYRNLIAKGNKDQAIKVFAHDLTNSERSIINNELAAQLDQYKRDEVFYTAAASVARGVRNTAGAVVVVAGAIAAAPAVIPASALGATGAFATGAAIPIIAEGSYETGQRIVELGSGQEVSGMEWGRELTSVERAERADSVVYAAAILSAPFIPGPKSGLKSVSDAPSCPRITGPGIDSPMPEFAQTITGPGIDGPWGAMSTRFAGEGWAVPHLPSLATFTRVGFRVGVRESVWNNAMESSSDGLVRSPGGAIIRPNQSWDMGHRPPWSFKNSQTWARQRGLTREQFIDEQNDPLRYRPETQKDNRSRRYE